MIDKSITIRAATARVSFHFAMMTFFTWFIFIIISACSIKFTAVSITSITSNTWHQLSFSAHCNCGTMAFSKVWIKLDYWQTKAKWIIVRLIMMAMMTIVMRFIVWIITLIISSLIESTLIEALISIIWSVIIKSLIPIWGKIKSLFSIIVPLPIKTLAIIKSSLSSLNPWLPLKPPWPPLKP